MTRSVRQWYGLWWVKNSTWFCIFGVLGRKAEISDIMPNFEESKAIWSDVENLVRYTEEIPTGQSNENEN